jgi:lipid A 4'-phosphatase
VRDGVATGKAQRSRLLAPFSSTAAIVAIAVAWLAVLLISNRFPDIDVAVSRTFFAGAPCQPARADAASLCGRFPAGAIQVLAGLRQILQATPLIVAVGLGIYLLIRLVKGARVTSPGILAGSAVFWTYVVSVGLLVNGLFKTYSGRPRPYQTVLFGGDLPFVPAGELTAYCAKNCSFVSGEAAAAFWLICLVPLLPRRSRLAGLLGAIAVALLTSAMRIAFGAHFLSDTILAGLLTLLVFAVLATIAARISEAQAPRTA